MTKTYDDIRDNNIFVNPVKDQKRGFFFVEKVHKLNNLWLLDLKAIGIYVWLSKYCNFWIFVCFNSVVVNDLFIQIFLDNSFLNHEDRISYLQNNGH